MAHFSGCRELKPTQWHVTDAHMLTSLIWDSGGVMVKQVVPLAPFSPPPLHSQDSLRLLIKKLKAKN